MRISARDIAEATGTSTASVSRAFRPAAPMSKELRDRILSTARDMGYVPPGGRAARKTGNYSVSLVVGDIHNPYYASVLDEFSQAAIDAGIELFFHIVPSGMTVDEVIHQVFAARTDCAIVTSAVLNSKIARQCQRRGLPVILFGRVQVDSRLNAISGDNYNGAQEVAKRFLRNGHKRIAYIGGLPNASTHMERKRGFIDQLEEAGVELFTEVSGGNRYQLTHDIVGELIAGGTPPDAVFCASDIMAFGAIDATRNAGLRLPEDIALIGYDDVPMAAWPSYRLTTVRQRLRLMIQEALKMTPELINDPSMQGRIKITPCHLVERESG